jgi:hypothetical protein
MEFISIGIQFLRNSIFHHSKKKEINFILKLLAFLQLHSAVSSSSSSMLLSELLKSKVMEEIYFVVTYPTGIFWQMSRMAWARVA